MNLCLRRGSVVNAADDSVMAFYANSPNDFSEMKKASRYKRKNSAYRVEGIMDSLKFSQLYRIKRIVKSYITLYNYYSTNSWNYIAFVD